jgi:HK97 family phage prohead protease
MVNKTLLRDAPERRAVAVSDFELRAVGDNLSLDGYATIFGHGYDVYGGPSRGGWTESVNKRAFDVTLREKPDLHLLINHEGMPLARTKSGTLQLSVDGKGLRVQAPNLDRRDPDVQRLEVKMARGDMDEMSFAFRVKDDVWNDEETTRDLTEVSLHKGDVSVVNFGANDATSAQMNSLLRSLAEMSYDDALAEVRSLNDPEALRAAHGLLGRLLREQTPEGKRTMSIDEARRIERGLPFELRGAIPVHHTETKDPYSVSFDGPGQMKWAAGQGAKALRAMCAWCDPNGDPEAASSYKFPHHSRGGVANLAGVRSALSSVSSSSIPSGDVAGVKAHLQAHLDDGGDSEDDSEE